MARRALAAQAVVIDNSSSDRESPPLQTTKKSKTALAPSHSQPSSTKQEFDLLAELDKLDNDVPSTKTKTRSSTAASLP